MVRRAADLFDERVVRPLKANQAASERHLLESTAIAPVVKAKVGYVRAAALVNQAAASGQSLLEVVVNDGVANTVIDVAAIVSNLPTRSSAGQVR